MAAHQVTHPSADALRAFALGKLNDSTAAVVMSHLDSCPDCCKQVAALAGDDFLPRLRQAHLSSSNEFTSTRSLGESAVGPKPPVRQPAIANLPPELANNPQYQILRELGRGGMGVVYLAKNKLMDRLEVLKVVNKALLDHPGAVERFLREIRAAAKLSHANVVGAYHALQMGELLAFAMEYIEGQDLANLVKSQGPLPIIHACYYAQQAALGLQHAFEKGMVHRDIKPQNLILAREGKKHIVKVLDFGLAKVMREKSEDTGLTGEGRMLGTPDYVAPEQGLDAAKADIRADIYSLGCTLYYLLSGNAPFKATSLTAVLLAHQMDEARPLNLVRPEVPEELAALVRKMMAKSPAERFQTPAEVVQALGTFVKQGATAKASPELSSGTQEAKPVVKLAARVDPPPTPAAEVPKQPPTPAAVWESLTESSAASIVPRKIAIVRKPRTAAVRERGSQKKWLIGGGVAMGVLLLALLGMWAGGVFKVKTPEGILIVEVNEPNPDVLVDGKTMTVTWHKGGKKAEIRVKPGTHKVEVKKDGFSVDGDDLTFKDGDSVIFKARLLPEKPEKGEEKAEAPPPEKTPSPPDTKKSEAPRVGDAAVDDKGFVPLFNGKDKTGWKTHPKQPGNWRVENDTLIGSGPDEVSHLYTERGDYKDFHLRLEVRTNSVWNGVWFRAPFETTVNGHPWSYNAKLFGLHVADLPLIRVRETSPPLGDWITFEVIAEGNHLTLKTNGTTTAEFFDDKRRFTSGHIALQQHGAKAVVEYRKIEIKELSPTATLPEPPKRAAKQKDSFFNEKDLTGWDGLPGYWQVKNGCIVGEPPPGQKAHTFLCSKRAYRDFDLKFRVKREGGVGNSGVQFRSQINNRSQFTVVGPQCEIDALNFTFPPGSLVTEPNGIPLKVKPSAAAQAELAKVYTEGGFNDFHIRCVGKHVTIKVNNVTSIDDDFPSLPVEGIIAWQLHGGRAPRSVWFRIVEFTDLSASASAEGKELPASKPEIPPAAKATTEEKGFVQLFNGKDTKGWRKHPRQPGNWHVEKGVLIGSGPTVSHLYSIRNNYKNFHLRVVARINDGGNSGVYFRTAFGPVLPPNNPMYPQGYEAQINTNSRDPKKTGSLIGINQVTEAPHKANEWFTMDVIAEGNHIVIKVNDIKTADYKDDKRLYTSGHIAVQQLDAATVVEFRKIEIKELK